MTPLEFAIHHPLAGLILATLAGATAGVTMQWIKIGLETWQAALQRGRR